MAKHSHTPGPWTIADGLSRSHHRYGDGARVIVPTGMPYQPAICTTSHGWEDGGAESEANANLIAAAPDMLDVLERFSKFPFSHQGPAEGPLAVMLSQARAAIAKARV